MSDPLAFGHWLRQRRKVCDLTQEALAEQVGCAVSTIRKIEAGTLRPSRQMAELLADYLAIPPAERLTFLQAARAELAVDRLGLPTLPTDQAAEAPLGRPLPTGTVTFLFTDIEGSTRLWEQHRAAMQLALARHDALLRQAIEAHGGVVVKTVGDGVHAAFLRATDAVVSALAAQRALHAADWGPIGALRVRMALHTGVAEEREGDYFGPALNRAARLIAAAHGGQTLLSHITAELVREHLPATTELRDLGEHRLKDLSAPEHIFQLDTADLPADFPPLRTGVAGPGAGGAIKGYELHERLGAGGFGAVYRAYQSVVGREVAIKIILPEYANHPDFIRRFDSEAQLVARLEHPYIVPLYDYWREPDGAYLVMRYMRGGSLHDALHHVPLSNDVLGRLIDQIGGALTVAHRRGVVHRDLKPANILLDEDGNAYLADFGIAKDLGNRISPYQTDATTVVGSPAYISPEQIKSEPITPQTDIYSLGVMLYEILTGDVPFHAPTPLALMFKHVNELAPPIREYRPDLSEAVNVVIQRAMAKNPAERYPDVPSLVQDLQRALAMAPATTRRLPELGQASSATPSPSQDSNLTTGAAQTRSKYDTGLLYLSTTVAPESAIENPYKGLRPFAAADADDFFGRESLIQLLLARMQEQGPFARFLAVVGPSGSGKSSVVRAGLLPALRRGGLPGAEHWFIVELLPGAHPLEELEAALLRVAVNPPSSLLEQLQADERGLLRAVKRVLPADEQIELVLVIDQFEEVFTLVADEAARTHMLNSLVAAVADARSRLRVVITLRADFMDRPLQYVTFGELLRQRAEFVLPLAPDELERAIVGPAGRVGLALEPGLVAAIVRDVGEQPGSLPLLQYALTELFERRVGPTLTLAAYQASGGVLGALARRAEDLHAELDAARQAATRQLFLRLITLGEGVEDTRRRVLRSELESVVSSSLSVATGGEQPTTDNGPRTTDNLIDLYGRYRLLTFDRDPITRGPTIEVAHEALIRSWDRLRGWLETSRESLRVQRRLLAAAAEWITAGRDPSFLATGARLAQFETLVYSSLALGTDERAYLHAGVAAREEQQAQEDAARQRELAQAQALAAEQQGRAEAERQRAETQTRASRRLRRRALLLAVLAVLALAAAVFAALQQQRANLQAAVAERQAHLALARQVLVKIGYLSGIQPDLPLLLSAAAAQIADTAETRASLLGALERNPYLGVFLRQHTDYVWSVAFSPDGKLLASASTDKTIVLWDVATRQPLGAPLHGHTDWVEAVAFSPDGKLLASGSADKTIILWDVAARRPLGPPLTGHTSSVWSVAFSPDGKLLASASTDKTIVLWDVATHRPLGAPLTGHTSSVWSVAFSPDGKLLASASADNTIIVWDVATLQPLGPPLRGHTDGVLSLAFSPDGKLLASASGDQTIRLWDVATHRPLDPPLQGHTNRVLSLAFSPDGKTLASGSIDETIILWDVVTRQPLGPPLRSHADGVRSVAFSPDGKLLASGSYDKMVILWNVATHQPLATSLQGHTDRVYNVAFSPDGKLLASASADKTIILWDVATRQPLGTPLRGHTDEVLSLAFSPDGKLLASASADRTIILWDVATRQPLGAPLPSYVDWVEDVAFSPDSKLLASPSSDSKTVILWGVATRQPLDPPLTGHTNEVGSITFSPDGKLLASGSADNTIMLWDVATHQPLGAPLHGHTGRVWSVAFSPDGKLLASGTDDKAIILWDVATHQLLGPPLTGHTNWVYSVAFSPDGKLLASASEDKTVMLWDVATHQPLGPPLQGHTGPVSGIAFSPDGTLLASSSADKTIILWDVSLEAWQAHACRIANRNLTQAEWDQFVGADIPYQRTCPDLPAGEGAPPGAPAESR